MSTTIISTTARVTRSKSASNAKQRKGLNRFAKTVICANVLTVLLYLFFASSVPGNLNRMSAEQAKYDKSNDQLSYMNQQIRNENLANTSDGKIRQWAAVRNFEKETAPEAPAIDNRNQASAATR